MRGMMGTREIRVGMRGIEWNKNRKKNEKKDNKIQCSIFPEIETKKHKKQKTKLEFS